MMGMAFVAVSIGLGVVFAGVVLSDEPQPPRQMQRQICDPMVVDFLTARDLVEVQRAGILVREYEVAEFVSAATASHCDVIILSGPTLLRFFCSQSIQGNDTALRRW
jgi:hypothetical protein